ncbi:MULTISPECIES: hypothetical protein [Pseudoxanthomonas]|uniref:Uncharacterized protein n=1 Tax=Pseudoxanthomonas taiwanensis J19 TaxID=935569 RepID=A0A562DMU5_9GAMM|nr:MULTISPECIES: hypothetical protein [Pseudoxanthomonas]TWH10940.1 hypothetical protein L613_002200000410 [Pseudoxanthomonas taiwanensis J19]
MQHERILAAALVATLCLCACDRDAGPGTTQGGTLQDSPTDTAAAAGNAADPPMADTPGTGAPTGMDTGGNAMDDGGTAGAASPAAAGAGAGAGTEAGQSALDRYPAAQRACVEEVARVSGTPAAELVVTGTARTQAGVEVRVQRQELRSAWTCQTDAQGGTVLGVQDGRAS